MKSLVLNKTQINNKIRRIAHELVERHYTEDSIILAGIDGQGYILAKRIHKIITDETELQSSLIKVSLNKVNPYDHPVELPISTDDLKGKTIVIIDDVLNSGKTMIYGIKAFLETKIKSLSSVVLVNRAHKRFPVEADHVGISLATTLQEHIEVSLVEGDESVYLV